MTQPFRRGAAAAVAIGLTVLVGALSQVPYAAGETEGAAVRLAWRVRSERVDECRRLTPEEIARLPAHMRREEVCEGRVLPYHLEVDLDGHRVVDHVVRPSGARADRPLYVFYDLPVPPGVHDLVVRFTRERAREESPASRIAAPPVLELARRLSLAPLEVALVTYDPEQRTLVLRGSTTSTR